MQAIRRKSGTRDGDSVAQLIEEWRHQRPDLDVSPLEILGRIQRLSTHLLRVAESNLKDVGLTWETFSLIATLRRSGTPYALRPTDIYRQSLLTSGTVTKRIDNVERMGLVRRVRDGKDRRSLMVRLTPKGLATADRAIALHLDAMAEVLSSLSKTEQASTADLLSKLLFSLEIKPLQHPSAKRRRTAARGNATTSSTTSK